MRNEFERNRFEANGEAAARAIFLKMPPWKWRLVCAFEGVLRLILPMLPAGTGREVPAPPKNNFVGGYFELGGIGLPVSFLSELSAEGAPARIIFPRAQRLP